MHPCHRTLLRLAAAVACAAIAADPLPLAAQYFGQNQVQYQRFDFQVLRTAHFDVYFYPKEAAAARDAGRMAERWYARLSAVLGHEFEFRQPLILYASTPEFQQTTTGGSAPGEGTAGFTEPLKQRVVMPLSGSYAETDHVVGHELVHAFQYDISGLGRAQGGLDAAASRFNPPGWFIEGMAEYLSLGPVDPNTAMWLRDAALAGKLPTIDDLTRDPRYFPYRWGQALWAYVGGRWGDAVIGQILKQVGEGVPYPEAFARILSTDLDELSEEWQASIRRAYLPLLTELREPREAGHALVTKKQRGGVYNVGPALSPDGGKVAFLSTLNDYDVQLYVADAASGRVQRTLVAGTSVQPHYASLNWIASAGVWSPDGERFALAAQRGGRDVLVVLDARSGRRLRDYAPEGIDEIATPTWSPDGGTVVFSGKHGGRTDLFALELATGTARALTDDAYADLQPAFSPDGRTLAFVTDRGPGTDLEALTYGGYRLAFLDQASGEVRPAPRMAGPRNVNPAWAADGKSVFFVSNRTGIPNVFRLEPATGELYRVTRLYGGVSGITDLSPSITVARGTERLVFTAYEDNSFGLYRLDGAALAGERVPPEEDAASDAQLLRAAQLPPTPRPTEPPYHRVSRTLADGATGLPTRDTSAAWQARPYRARLSLDYVGQPQLGFSSGSSFTGGGLYSGVTGLFSDPLGHHTVIGTVQAQGPIDETGAAAVYINRRNRLTWGAVAQRIPYVYGFYTEGIDPTEPDLFRRQIVRLRYFDTSLEGVVHYPFSRVQRLEVGGGVRQIGTDAKIQEYLYDVQSGGFVGTDRRTVDGESFTLAQGGAALVYDNALVGYTAPLAGQRYRLELAPVAGDLRYLTALADYRRYLRLGPATLAVRGLHYGRYGGDAERFSQIFVGHSSLVRGYGSADEDCTAAGTAGCELLNAALGSRVGVVNAELRFPLLGPGGVLEKVRLPVDGFIFHDAGVAWNGDTRPVLERGVLSGAERGILTSMGLGARVNVLGFAVVEIDYVNALDRARGWHWQFSLQPGF
ncbi:MAG TPA: hypothetical protein VFX98_10030 [Longimicrobiaceae bacterium]|nr:hypothetical protein [Longimicrobiaceae bacterium]